MGKVSSSSASAHISEKDFQQTVIDMFNCAGWLVFHPYDSRRSAYGFPDLTMVSPNGRLVFAELKTEKGKVTNYQKTWLDRLNINTEGYEAYLWRPSDMPQIELVLSGGVPARTNKGD